MIIGTGIDIIEVSRIKKNIENEAFVKKIFSPREIEYCQKNKLPEQSFAARFAAKEAFMKALGVGFRKGINFTQIEVLNNDLGKPEIILQGTAKDIANSQKVENIYVSLSHLKELAVAQVILEK